MYKIRILSRHPSHRILRRKLPELPVRSAIRFGSTTELNDGKNRIEINSVSAIKLSANKRFMKECFDAAECPTAKWTTAKNTDELLALIEKEKIWFPIVAKHIFGSRGTGNSLLKGKNDLLSWARNRDFDKYIFENYSTFLLEYRLHVTKNGCFYACRKALMRSTDASERWRRHIDNCVWLIESNPDFHKPNSWKDIEGACVKALNEIQADVLSFDVRVQNRMDKEGNQRKHQDFILIECNSASAMHSPQNKEISLCASKYLEVLPKLIMEKAGK
jgi:hypothetical protein